MNALKWNYGTHKYDPVTIPDGSRLDAELDTPCECASCGAPMLFGFGYCSMVIHNAIGFAYAVCHDCYVKERAADLVAKRKLKGETK